MCQLLGFSRHPEAHPAALLTPETLGEFAARGGLTDCHADGWGLGAWSARSPAVDSPKTSAFTDTTSTAGRVGSPSSPSLSCPLNPWHNLDFERRQRVQIWRDKAPAHTGRLAQLLRQHLRDSVHFLSHLRRATWGAPSLDNTHPFTARVLGRDWAFAHNGHLPVAKERAQALGVELGAHASDSQHALAWMSRSLQREPAFEAVAHSVLGHRLATVQPSPMRGARSNNQSDFSAEDFERLATWHEAAEEEGTFNTLMGCEAGLFAHASTQLWSLEGDGFTLIATEPIGEGLWLPLRRGQSLWIRHGRIIHSKLRCSEPPRFALPVCIGLHPEGLSSNEPPPNGAPEDLSGSVSAGVDPAGAPLRVVAASTTRVASATRAANTSGPTVLQA